MWSGSTKTHRVCALQQRTNHSAVGRDARSNNIGGLGNTLRTTLKNVEATLPPDLKLDMVADQPKVVFRAHWRFLPRVGIAIVAVILVTMLLLPLRCSGLRIAIPVSVAMTFGH